MKDLYPIKLYLKHIPNLIMLATSVMFNCMIWVWLAWNIRPQEGSVFLHYTVLFGVDLTGPWYRVFSVPMIGIGILLINGALGWVLFSRDKFVSHILNATTLLCHIFLLVAASLLVFLNV